MSKVQFTITNDKGMKKVNKLAFDEDTTTDVISFPVSKQMKEITGTLGELVINEDEVRRNAEKYSVSYEQELARVVSHGVLHLLGYEDDTEEKKQAMSAIEDSVVEQIESNK